MMVVVPLSPSQDRSNTIESFKAAINLSSWSIEDRTGSYYSYYPMGFGEECESFATVFALCCVSMECDRNSFVCLTSSLSIAIVEMANKGDLKLPFTNVFKLPLHHHHPQTITN